MVSRSFLFVALLLASLSVPVGATRFYVNQSTGDNRRSHIVVQDADTPWRTITHALKMAHIITQDRPHVIDIASGTYSPASGEIMPFVISQTDIYFRSQGGVLLDGQRQSGILEITAPTSDFVLRDFSLLNGTAQYGGAVSCQSCSLRVVDSRLLGNEAAAGGDAIYVADGRLQLFRNIIRTNGSSGTPGAIIEVRNTFADTSQRDVIRNNTFYLNKKPTILTTGNRTDISSNILVGSPGSGLAAIVDSAVGIEPLIRYNLFWDTDILYLSGDRDSVKVARTVRDTLTLEEQGVAVPTFVTNVPDTVAKIGSLYEFDIQFQTAKSNYKYTVINPGDIPVGMSEQTIEESGILSWTPIDGQAGQHAVRVEIIRQTPPVQVQFLSFIITAFTADDFPDTTTPGDVITVSTVPDTSGAVDSLNMVLPLFSIAASSAGNVYGDPLFLNTEINRFELLPQKSRLIIPAGDSVAVPDTLRSVAIDAGDPTAIFNDAITAAGQVRNDMGTFGGAVNTGPPTPGTPAERPLTWLPDSVAVEGEVWTYDAVLSPSSNIFIIDLIQGPPTMGDAFGSSGSIPATWVPAVADTGSFLVGIKIFFSGGSARHYFPLRVRAGNSPPRITSTAPTVASEDVEFVYAVDAVDDDGDTILWSIDSGPEGMTVDSLGVVRWTASQADVGSTAIVIGLNDAGGAGNTHSFSLSVSNTNDVPVAATLADTSATEDLTFLRALSAVDEDPSDSVFTFSLTTGPDSASIDAQNRLVWTPLQADVGAHVLTVRVSDAAGAVDSTSFTLTVIEVDDGPSITSTPDTTALEDSAYEYVVGADDEERAAITYALVTAPTGMSIVDTTGVISWTPALADIGTHTVSLLIADPGGQTAAQSYELQVLAVNDPPVILSRTPSDTLVLIDPGQGVQFELDSSDEEGDQLTLQWLVNGKKLSVERRFLHVADTTSADTVVANLSDGTNTTSTTWIVDARAIAKISVATDTVDFDTVVLDSTASVTLRVLNPGRTTLNINHLQVGDLAFSATFGTDAIALRDSTILTLSFTGMTRGVRSTTVQFGTNDPDVPTVTIPLIGVAVVPTTAALDANPASGNQGLRTVTGRTGQTASIDLQVDQAVALVSYAVELSFDPQILSFEAFSADADATNLLGTGLTTSVTEPSAGTVRVDIGPAAAASGAGTLGRWTFGVAADAEAGSSTAIGVTRVELLSSGLLTADVLTASTGIELLIANALPGDSNGDGAIDFDDFFSFADDFGTSEPRSDFNNDGIVDFTDFFLFADYFNAAAARPLPRVTTSIPGLVLATDQRPQNSQRVDVSLLWHGEEPLRGAGLWLTWDPQHLVFDELSSTAPEAEQILLWSQPVQPGRLEMAAAPVQGSAFDTEIAVLHFGRLTAEGTEFRIDAAIGRDRAGVTNALDLPPAEIVAALPRVAMLYPAHPNPFNPETVIPFFIPSGPDVEVEIRIFDLLGRVVRELSSGPLSSGHHQVVWHGRDEAGRQAGAGVYLVEMQTAQQRLVRKVMLLK